MVYYLQSPTEVFPMPSNFTHRIFGREVLNAFSSSVPNYIQDNLLLFQMGLHGPDLLFYYKPPFSTPLSKLGYSLHRHSGNQILTTLLNAVDSLPEENRDGGLAYTMGFACHFLSDSVCHPYVYQLIQSGKSDHCTLEAQMDYWLMMREGASPLDTDPISHLNGIGDREFAIISPLIAALSKLDSPNAPLKARPRQIASAYHSMQRVCRIFGSRRAIVRGFAHLALLVSGTHDQRKGLIFSKSPDPYFFGCNEYMLKLLTDSAQEAPILLESIRRRDLGARFECTFEG